MKLFGTFILIVGTAASTYGFVEGYTVTTIVGAFYLALGLAFVWSDE